MSDKANKKSSGLARIKKAKITKVKENLTKTRRTKITKETLARAVTQSETPKLLFSLDGTESRRDAWIIAQEISIVMFENIPEKLDVGLAYHGGGRLKAFTSFSSNKNEFRKELLDVEIEGGLTKINKILEKAVLVPRLKAIAYIGDCFEEDANEALYWAKQLSLHGTRVFIFHEKHQYSSGEDTFNEIARITRGAVLPFDMNSAELLREILEAIAYYASQGIESIKQLKSAGSQLLLEAMN